MSRFFIARPIFAFVIAIVVALAGLLAIRTLPITQYPSIAPPSVVISANYPGASAATVESSVTQVIEQQFKGLDHLMYFSANSSADGRVQITVTFEAGTNPDIAQVQVQNKLQAAMPTLPAAVQQQGVTVNKSQPSFLMVVGLSSSNDQYRDLDLGDIVNSRFVDALSRIDGVGDVNIFGSQYAMRIWLDPYKMQHFGLMPSDIRAAVLAQNTQVSAGQIGGQPTAPGQVLNATVTARSFLQTPDQFKAIVLRAGANGAVVHLADVARVEMGGENYGVTSQYNGRPSAGVAILLAPGANALKTADAVKARARELAEGLPPGVMMSFPVDNTTFIKISIRDVIITLMEAVCLVVAVMFLFLQNWRVTLVPALAVPVVLLGTFGVLSAFGYSINTLTMFAMVLAIGLLVDDAIVVVENVERIMHEERLAPREATLKSMGEITGALIGIALVLAAVFLPMAFFGGSTGVIYRQFSVTIVSAMALSVFVALILTPALCATLLRPARHEGRATRGLFGLFNRGFDGAVKRYSRTLADLLSRPRRMFIAYAVIVSAMGLLIGRLPTAFLPEEDQGLMMALFNLPPGATLDRTVAVAGKVRDYFLGPQKDNVESVYTVEGNNFSGSGQNLGMAFVHLADWSHRHGPQNHAPGIARAGMGALSHVRDGQVFLLVPPAVRELGNSTGFDVQLEDRGGLGHERLLAARNQFLGMAAQDPILVGVRPNGLEDTPQLHVEIDAERAGALGLSQSDVDDTISAASGGQFINNFVDRGRVKRVFMQGDAPYRGRPESIGGWYVRGSGGAMSPFAAFSTQTWVKGPAQLQRYNGFPSVDLQGQSAPGRSSGAAMAEVRKLMAKLPPGVGYEFTGLSYQEQLSGSQAPALLAVSMLVVFLCLAALYESWSIPAAVMMMAPVGVFGAVLAATLRGFYNDIYFQIGLLTTIGLSAKNGILIVQFAVEAEKRGVPSLQAALDAARLRLRPIIMTSLAFIAGVLPLALSSGAGAGSQNDIGVGVIGGVFAATGMGIFFVPLFFVSVRRWFPPKAAMAEAGV